VSSRIPEGVRAADDAPTAAARGAAGPRPGGAGYNPFAVATSDPRYKWKVLVSVIFGLFMVILDSTVVNVALKTLQQQFSVSTNEAQWVISVYTLALGIATPLSGFLGERFGIKKIYITGLALFVFGSVLCGLAVGASDNIVYLVAARAIQGAGGGIALPLGTAMLFGAFPPRERGVALGIFGIALVFAPASGPLLGGWLVDHNLLNWIFYVNLPIGILGISLASFFLKDRRSDRVLKADIPGIILSTLGFGALLYGASIAGEQGGGGWTDPQTLIAFTVGVLALIAFVFVELRSPEPLLDLRLFAIRTFTVANIVGWVGIIALFGAEFLLPLYLQILRGMSAFDTGLFLLPLAITSGVITPIAGRLSDKIGPRVLLVLGFGLIAFNTWQLREITMDTSLDWLTFLLVVRGVGFGLVIQTTLVAALRDIPGAKTARATSLVNATRQTIQSIGVAALATILTSAITINIGDEIRKNLPNPATLPAQARAAMEAGMQQFQAQLDRGGTPDLAQVPAQIRPVIENALHTFQQQYIAGLDHAYTATFVVAVLAALLSLFLPGWPAAFMSPAEAAEAGEAARDAPVPAH
jgi:DHA2 family multidrug resistance protein